MDAAEMAKKLSEHQRTFALAGILSFGDKVIDEQTANTIRRILTMTKVGQMIADEIEQKVAEQVEQKVAEQVAEQVAEKEDSDLSKFINFAKRSGLAMTDVVEELISSYNYTPEGANERVLKSWI